jgi:hypothetical protein
MRERSWLGHFARTGAATLALVLLLSGGLFAQGVTTGQMGGFVRDVDGNPIEDATIIAIHNPSGTSYGTTSRGGGAWDLPNLRVGGPYTITVTMIGYEEYRESGVYLTLAQNLRQDFALEIQAVEVEELAVQVEENTLLNAGRTGAATFVSQEEIEALPALRRTFRDIARVDPRADENMAFGGRNWLYNNISLDGSYFNNAFGLDDPVPGGQAASEPIPYTAIEQVTVQVAPFDIRQGGFTGANVNIVSKSGTNDWQIAAYGFFRNQDLLGNNVRGQPVVANPDLNFGQYGASIGGPIIKDKLFFFVNGEINRRDDPGTNFVANEGGSVDFGESRVDATTMDAISQRLMDVYGYDTGPYQGFVHETDSDKLLFKLDWNISGSDNFVFRYNFLDASRDLPPHPFVLSAFGSGRGPNQTSLPFQNSGYTINNNLNSWALELNSRSEGWANRAFVSYNRFRDHRDPLSAPFPTVEIAEGGVTYTTAGHEPFSISNILHSDVFQFTDNFTFFSDEHSITVGTNFETFRFFNSFNLFRHGVFFLPPVTFVGTTYSSLDEFFDFTDPNSENFQPLNALIGIGSACGNNDCPLKGEDFTFGQLSFYAQDEYEMSTRFSLTYGLRIDMPMYFTDPVDKPFSRSLDGLDQDGNTRSFDQSEVPGTTVLWSPRVGFNWAAAEDRSVQLRGGSGIFTGRIPFVWGGNNYSNPGANPNIWNNDPPPEAVVTGEGCTAQGCQTAVLQQSFFLNAFDPDFKWPQTWVTDIALDFRLPGAVLSTFEVIYGRDINAVQVYNADVGPQTSINPIDGRPVYDTFLNPEIGPGNCICVIDNRSDGWNVNLTAQFQRVFDFGLSLMAAYAYTDARNTLKSTEIADNLWRQQPVQGDHKNPALSHSEFGQQHRILGPVLYPVEWSRALATSFGFYFNVANGNSFRGAGGNRYSFIYSGDVNKDGSNLNDLIYIPRDQSEIMLDPFVDSNGNVVTPNQQWAALDAFIEQDSYLSQNRGQIAERFGLLNPFWANIDFKLMQDFRFGSQGSQSTIRLHFDILNFGNLLSSDWGVRQVASAAATNPLTLTRFEDDGTPVFNFNMVQETFTDDLSVDSRWRFQLGLQYLFN